LRTEGLVDPDRLREALVLLREALPTGITRRELAARLSPDGVSLRSVDRVMALLEAQGARFERNRAGQSSVLRFVLLEGPTWDEHISPDARLALRLAALSLSHCGTLLWQDKLDTLERLATKHMSNRDRRLFTVLEHSVQIQGAVEDPIEAQDILEPILRALEGRREIQADYTVAGTDEPRKRRFVPFCLTHDLFSGAAFLAVWDPEEQKPKHLRLNRIENVRVLPRPGIIPHPEIMARAARYQIGGWICDDPPFEIQVRISGTHWLQAFKEAPPALPDFAAHPAEDGQSAVVTFKANHPNGAIRWVLQFGACAQVLEPAWLCAEVLAQLQRAADAYRAGSPQT
jgi:predicted DNA-binding transcriptional regulator YafY